MSSEFTEYPLENEQVEVYASTNKYMHFALARLDETEVPEADYAISRWFRAEVSIVNVRVESSV
jgi:hypothetical protein